MKKMSGGNIFGAGSLLQAAVFLLVAVFVSGCAAPPLKEGNMVPTGTGATWSSEANALFRDGIVIVRKGEKINKIESAVLKTIMNAGWDRKDASAKPRYTLHVSVVSEPWVKPELGLGSFAGEFNAGVVANYVLQDASSNSIFDETIQSYAKADISDKALGAERVTFVTEKVVQINIHQFMYKLDDFAKQNFQRLRAAQSGTTQQNQMAENFKTTQQNPIVESLKSYDIFSAKPFYVAYPPSSHGNYDFADVYSSAKSVIDPKLRAASLPNLRRFFANYGEKMYSSQKWEIQALINERQQQADKSAAQESKPREAIKTAKPVPKPQPTSKPEQTVEKKPQAEQPVKAQPAPNPF